MKKIVIKKYIKTKCPRLSKLLLTALAPYYDYKRTQKKKQDDALVCSIVDLQEEALRLLKGKPVIRCVFFATEIADWKCDSVYLAMRNHPRFEPQVLVCPIINCGKEYMLEKLEETTSFFESKGYNPIKSYDAFTDKYVDVRESLSPDLIFFTSPYENLVDDRYNISHYSDCLTMYIPYGFTNNKDLTFQYNLLLHNLVWRYYVESQDHLKYAQNISMCKGRNAVVTGYPAIERYLDKRYIPKSDPWKIKDRRVKRIIWAPHHTIEPVGNVAYSCFLVYADFMLQMAEKYSDDVQFVFKPHPLLQYKLETLWGRERTNAYYSKWNSMLNTSVELGDYVDLFLSSDAMIHDSGSFITEYLYVNKPVMRTVNDIPFSQMYNDFVIKCLDNYYLAKNKNDVEQFIIDVMNGVDELKEKRTKFLNDTLVPNGLPSQNIIDDILDSIDNQILYRN